MAKAIKSMFPFFRCTTPIDSAKKISQACGVKLDEKKRQNVRKKWPGGKSKRIKTMGGEKGKKTVKTHDGSHGCMVYPP